MEKQRYKEIGAAVAGVVVVTAAAFAGALWTLGIGTVSREANEASEALPLAPYRGLPFILEDRHLTEWSGMSGGAVRGAEKVRTTSIPAIGTPFPPPRTPVEEINARWPKEVGK